MQTGFPEPDRAAPPPTRHYSGQSGGFSWRALTLGFRRRCPQCGVSPLFAGYLRVVAECAGCGLALAQYRSDDAPAYFTIAIIGHIAVFGLLLVEQTVTLPMWLLIAIFAPATLIATLALLPRIKGALVGLHWTLKLQPARAAPRDEP